MSSSAFDALKDVTPITIVGGSPFVLGAHPSLGGNNLKDLADLGKPGKLTIGSAGNGTILHLALRIWSVPFCYRCACRER